MKKTYIITLFLNQQILFESISFANSGQEQQRVNIYQQILLEYISFANGGQEQQRENICSQFKTLPSTPQLPEKENVKQVYQLSPNLQPADLGAILVTQMQTGDLFINIWSICSSVHDGIYALGKAHMYSTQLL